MTKRILNRHKPIHSPHVGSVRSQMAGIRLVLSGIVAAMLWGAFTPPAEASLRQLFQLPDQVDQLKQQYDETKQKYNETIERYEETQAQLESAARERYEETRKLEQSLEQYRESEQSLRNENDRLARQNEQLIQAVTDLQQAEQARLDRSRRNWTMIWTGATLIGFYFLSSRLFRLVLRRQSNKHFLTKRPGQS